MKAFAIAALSLLGFIVGASQQRPIQLALFLRGENHGRKVWVDRNLPWPDFVARCRARLALWDAGTLRFRDEDFAEMREVHEIDDGQVIAWYSEA